MKISIKDLKRMILEQVGDEDESVSMQDATGKTRLSVDSVDDQIDSHLIRFETDSVIVQDETIMESLSNLDLRALLFEQDDVEVEDEIVGAEPPVGSEDIEVEEPIEPIKRPSMNIDAFTKRVAQLALGYNVRLDVPTVIINRALNFLKEGYGEEYVEEFKEILDTQFDFNVRDVREPSNAVAGGRDPAIGAYGEPEGLPATGGGGD